MRKLKTLDNVMTWVGENAARVSMIGSGSLICFMVFLITIDVIARGALGRGTLIATAASGYALIGVVFLGLAAAQLAGLHVTVNLLTRRLHPRLRDTLEIASLLIVVAFSVWLAWALFELTRAVYASQAVSIDRLRIKMWIVYSVGPLGVCMYALVLVSQLYRRLRDLLGSGGT